MLYNDFIGGYMKIAITAESTVDLPKDLLEKYQIKTVPFTVILGDKEYLDGEIGFDDIYKFVEESKVLPKTSAINKDQYTNFFNEVLKDNDAIVHISLSSQISSAYQNAVAVSEEFENVFVVDSKSLSTGIALLAIYARSLTEQSLDAKTVFDKVMARVEKVQASFVIKKLEYLYKGGRCSALSYFGANLMHIRPQILLKDGKMGVHRKYRGNMDKVISAYCKDTLNEFDNPDLSVGFVTYTTASDEMIDCAKKALKDKGFKEIYETKAGGTISSHCGENTLGILYINDGGQI